MTHTAKHTPGPLKAVQIIIENSPCTWAVQRKNIREQWGKPSIATYIDNEADARLFATAPAMYAETRAAFELLIDLRDLSVMPSAYQAIIQKRITALQTVLAQAEGKAL